ncbi:hypothetical protein LEAN103870_19295 [Legionella anisa]
MVASNCLLMRCDQETVTRLQFDVDPTAELPPLRYNCVDEVKLLPGSGVAIRRD